MSLNKFIANGKLPHFDGTFKPAEGDKKAFLSWAVSVKRDFKPEGAQYYPEDLIPFKAFGPKAEFINNFFKKGNGLIITGRLQRDEDYTDKDGNLQKGQLFLLVEDVTFAEGSKNSEEGATQQASSASSSRPAGPGARPTPAARPGGPGSRPAPAARPGGARPASRPW